MKKQLREKRSSATVFYDKQCASRSVRRHFEIILMLSLGLHCLLKYKTGFSPLEAH